MCFSSLPLFSTSSRVKDKTLIIYCSYHIQAKLKINFFFLNYGANVSIIVKNISNKSTRRKKNLASRLP